MSNNININKNIILSNKESAENAEKINFEKEIENLSTKEKEFTKISNNDTKKEPIYIMTLELEKGKPEKINIYSDSDPKQIASDFCREHNLDYNGLDYLKKRIESLLNQKSLEQKEKMAQSQKNENININKESNNQYYEINNNSKANIQNNDINNNNNYNLNSPKKNTNNKNKSGTENNYNFNKSSSKKPGHKCKARIQNNEDSDEKFDKIYQEMKYKNYIQNENNNFMGNKNKIKNYNEFIDDRKKQLKLEKEKELFELQRKINKKKNIKLYNNESKTNSSIKNYRKKNYFNHNYNYNNDYKYNTKKVDNKITKILKEYEEKYSFHPSINDNFKTDLTFEERQTIYNNIYKKRKEELRNFYLNSKKDEKGDFLFKPRLISKPKYKNNDEEKEKEIKGNIFHKNYLFWKKYNLDKEQLYKKYYSNNKYEPIIFTKKQNEKIINETKSRAFNNLFKDLDGDQDNIINGINISIYKIPDNIYKIIEPLLNELKEDNQSLSKEEFIIAMNKLYENLSSLERRTIINTYSKKLKQNKSFNTYDSFLNKNNNTNNIRTSTQNSYINEKTIPNKNSNTNKLALKHYKKISRMLDNIYESNKKSKKFCNINLNKSKNENIKENKYFGTDTNKIDKLDKIDDNFTYICNCTFNNYIRKLN